MVSLDAYRAAIGLFTCLRISISVLRHVLNRTIFIIGVLLTAIFIAHINIILSNDVELEPEPSSSFKFGHLNIRSLNNDDKFDELSFLLKENNFHIFALTETWLKNRISSENFRISGYNPIIRLGRKGKLGGGIAFFTCDSLVVKRRRDLELTGFEFL